jgi:hypothetical protein
MIVVARDLYPPYRVDVVELFSKFVTKAIDLEWLMRPSKSGPAYVAGAGSEIFHVIGRARAYCCVAARAARRI